MAESWEKYHERFEKWASSLPRCVGDAGACDGNLVGLEHEDNCPMKGVEEPTFFDAWLAGRRDALEEPDIEAISAKVHERWMESKRAKGVTTRRSETGEELMVPYEQLSESAKDLDRGSVEAVLAAIRALEEKP
jgi:hypothetical protein